MDKLELKDICGYFPYGLKVVNYCGDIDDAITLIDNMSLTGFADNSKPILRPISDLTKEITHKGKKFVPIVELAKIAFPNRHWIIDNECAESDTGWWFWYDKDTYSFAVDGTISNIVPNQLILFDKLSEWMFDYRGLIDNGLAIDVNNLEINPYE